MRPRYRIVKYRHLDRDLGKIPAGPQQAVREAISALADNPRPPGSKRLQGQRRDENFRRVRVGVYRVIYDVDDDAQLVRIVLAGHRQNVYQLFGRQ